MYKTSTICALLTLAILLGCKNDEDSNGEEGSGYKCGDPMYSYMLNNYEEPADVYKFLEDGLISFSKFEVKEGNYASIKIYNKHENACPLLISLASYKMYSNRPEDIVRYKKSRIEIPPNSERRVKVGLPECMAEIGIYLVNSNNERYGPPKTQKRQSYMNSLIGWTYQYNTNDIPAENDMLNGWGKYDKFPDEDANTGESIAGLHRRYDDSDTDDGHSGAKPHDRFCAR